MTNHPRIEFAGAVYHVSSRGRNRQAIFLSDDDRRLFFDDLQSAVDKYGFIIHAYCLMGNHYHLLIETPTANLSAGMQFLNSRYTRSFKKKYGKIGSLFGGPYNAVLIDIESQLLETARYIVLNPVRAKLVRTPEEFTWSSYLATAGLEAGPQCLSTKRILEGLSAEGKSYIKFVADGIVTREMNMTSSLPFTRK
jgi:putative transposase